MASHADFSRLPTLFSFLLVLSVDANATSVISSELPLSGNRTVSSRGGAFELGFFRAGEPNASRHYVGIWFGSKKVSKFTPIWVANRDAPVGDPAAAQLVISGDGNLVLLGRDGALVWSTNITSAAARSAAAELMDSGNLVLRDSADPGKVLWQSFDHPTDTWLPGVKFALDKATGKGPVLTSWKNSEDPAAGIFSMELDPTGVAQFVAVWNRSRQYWSTGVWNGRFFSSISEMTAYRDSNIVVNVSIEFGSNATTNYFMYEVRAGMITRSVINVSGQLKQLVWWEDGEEWIEFLSLPNRCDVYALCGAFGSCNEERMRFCKCVDGFSERFPRDWELGDQSGGCARNTPLQYGDKDAFITVSDVRLPEDPHSAAAADIEKCESLCLANRSCTAYSFGRGCSLWYGDLLNLQEMPPTGAKGQTIHVRVAASELQNPGSRRSKGLKLGAIGMASVFALTAFALVLFLVRRRRRRKLERDEAIEGNLVVFRYSELQRMTKSFSTKLGGGGFGSVFKGTLPDSTAIAVKKLRGLHLRMGEKQFRTEVSTIGVIHHVNLVRLRGFCSEGSQRLLVYEFMPKGSLNNHLFRRNTPPMDWKTRYNIAIGTARALAYLHEQCRDCIIHCDVKPENILLDESFRPKLADFGLAKLVGRDFSKVLTTLRGTVGYLAPEWISGEAITPKADAYSYGMTLLEIISGRRNWEQPEDDSNPYFPVLAARKVAEGDVLSLLDPRLGKDANLKELERACKVACWCIQDEELHRPSMAQVVQILEGALEVNSPPVPRSLRVLTDHHEAKNGFSDETSSCRSSSILVLSSWSLTPPAESTYLITSNLVLQIFCSVNALFLPFLQMVLKTGDL